MIEQGLYQLITSDAGVKAAVGTDANGTTRAFWILAPQGATVPFLVFSRVSTGDNYDTSGPIGLRDGLFQVVCYSTTYYGSRKVAEVVRKFLENYSGTLPDTDATVVSQVFIEKDFDDRYEEGFKGFIYGAYLQFRVWYYDGAAVPILTSQISGVTLVDVSTSLTYLLRMNDGELESSPITGALGPLTRLVFQDTATGSFYALAISGGSLTQTALVGSYSWFSVVLQDIANGGDYQLVVSNGVLEQVKL
jgi:hypothetical protein